MHKKTDAYFMKIINKNLKKVNNTFLLMQKKLNEICI